MYPFDFTHPVVGKASIEIPKPIVDVFAFVGEEFFKNYPKWAQDVAEFQPLTGETAQVGAKARQTRSDKGQVVESVFEISEFVPPIKMTLNGVEQAYRNTYNFAENGDDRHTQLEFSFELLELEIFMRPFEKLIRMAIEEGAETTVANIKNLMCNRIQ